ncbi:MAG: DUF1080 domain-containing protein [Candidatus Hydrogenedentes bacterium]|nr:DUF1080 domain-containing protein [Candidatus Hydrogenedentota bacterium]
MLTLLVLHAACFAAPDNTLTDQEKSDGWVLLFDGKTLDGWTTPEGAQSKTPIQDGCINPHGCGGYMMTYKEPLGDFVLACDFKISPKCNSGIFVRTFPLTPLPGKDVGWNGVEIAIDDTTEAGYVDTGAIYDLSKPAKNAMKPVGEWNHIEITCKGPVITVVLNGEKVNECDLSKFTEPNKRPDGSAHKFDHPFNTHPQKGYIGLQDHGSDCWYKNIKIRPLKG